MSDLRDWTHFVVCLYQSNKNFKPIRPTEIIFLRTSVAAHPAPLPGGTDVFFEIVDPDEQFHDCFVVVKHFHQGKIIGKRLECHLEAGSQRFNVLLSH